MYARFHLDADLHAVSHDARSQLSTYPAERRARTHLRLEPRDARGSQPGVWVSRCQAEHLLCLIVGDETSA